MHLYKQMSLPHVLRHIVGCGAHVISTLETGTDRKYHLSTEQELEFFERVNRRLRNEVHTTG